MASITGAMVENNKFCLSVHFRCVHEEVKLLQTENSNVEDMF
jgi:trehalose-6-phosphatase